MMSSRISRLEALEARHNGSPLIVLARLPDGTEAILSAKEMLSKGGYLVRVISGNSLLDLDAVLAAGIAAAYEESEV